MNLSTAPNRCSVTSQCRMLTAVCGLALIDPLNALCLAADLEQESGYASRAIHLEVDLKVLNLLSHDSTPLWLDYTDHHANA
ncbi:MAG TPA: hypothetical protein VIY49_28130 [Bryobacteraceae bacterium]